MFRSWLLKSYLIFFAMYFCSIFITTVSNSHESDEVDDSFSEASVNRVPLNQPEQMPTKVFNEEGNENKKWVDPNDMFSYNPSTKSTHKNAAVLDKENGYTVDIDKSKFDYCSECYEKLRLCHHDKLGNFTGGKSDPCNRMEFPYLLRILKILVNRIELDSTVGTRESSTLQLKFNRDDIKAVMLFIDSPCHHIQDVELTLSRIISESVNVDLYGNDILFQMPRFAYDSYLAWTLCAFLVLAAVWICIFLWACRFHPIKTLILFIFICSVFWHWMHLYKSRLADNVAKLDQLTPEHCLRSSNLGVLSSFMLWVRSNFMIDHDDCAKYHRAVLVDPFWEVSPTMALSETLSVFIFHPLTVLGDNFSIMVKNLFSHLPFYLAVPLSITVIIILWFLLIMMFGYRLHLPFFLGTFEPVFTSFKPLKLSNQDQRMLHTLNVRRVEDIENDSSNFIKDSKKDCGERHLKEVLNSHLTGMKPDVYTLQGSGEPSHYIKDVKPSDSNKQLDKYCQTLRNENSNCDVNDSFNDGINSDKGDNLDVSH